MTHTFTSLLAALESAIETREADTHETDDEVYLYHNECVDNARRDLHDFVNTLSQPKQVITIQPYLDWQMAHVDAEIEDCEYVLSIKTVGNDMSSNYPCHSINHALKRADKILNFNQSL